VGRLRKLLANELITPCEFTVVRERLLDAIGDISSTLLVAVGGYIVAIMVGIPLAVALALSRFLSRTVFPILVVIHSTPIVAIAPIIVVTLGVGLVPRIVITFLISFFPIIISTVAGIVHTPEELLEMSRSLKAPRIREIVQIRLPSAVPYIFSALKVSITLSVIGALNSTRLSSPSRIGGISTRKHSANWSRP
jgi:NitT/TauT family transport system permease protein